MLFRHGRAKFSDDLVHETRGSLRQAIGHGTWAFFRTYVLRRGFLDGREGFLLAVANAEVAFYRYVKLLYLNKK